MENKICIIVAYFGTFPRYFPLWLKSCENNPTVDFLIVTDVTIEKHPFNVIVYNTTLESIKNKASSILGFEVSLMRPYKMCDYKPMYGLLFSDNLKEYDYWGHCDVDLIFGDLKYFFEKYDLYKYDRFLPLGHLSLYKNNEEVNNRFKCDDLNYNYEDVFTNNRSYAFDEFGGMTSLYATGGFPFFKKRIFADIASIYHRYRLIEEYLLDECPHNYPYQIFSWENGKCYREWISAGKLYREEYVYIHFKKRPNFEIDFNLKSTESFYITNIGFISKTRETDMNVIADLNPYKSELYEIGEYLKAKSQKTINSLKRKIKRG